MMNPTVITSQARWTDIKFKEIWAYRDLIYLLIRRDFISLYKQTVLGPIWFILVPLISTFVFTAVFGKVAKISAQGVPHFLFYFSGLICWGYFAQTLSQISNTFLNNAGTFGKVYFPRLVVPVSQIFSNLIALSIHILFLVAFIGYFRMKGNYVHPSYWLLALPMIILQMAMLALGTGLFLCALTAKYRDLSHVASLGIQLWMFLTPVIYAPTEVPEGYRWLYGLNPIAPVIEQFRHAFLGTGGAHWAHYTLSWMMTALVLGLGLLLFSRTERNFMDTI